MNEAASEVACAVCAFRSKHVHEPECWAHLDEARVDLLRGVAVIAEAALDASLEEEVKERAAVRGITITELEESARNLRKALEFLRALQPGDLVIRKVVR